MHQSQAAYNVHISKAGQHLRGNRRTKVEGKEENDDEALDAGGGFALAGTDCGVVLRGPFDLVSSPCFPLEPPPSCPFFFSHAMSSGSLSSAHPTSMSCKPLSACPLAHTAANAPPICLNGTRAMPRFGFFGGAGLSMSLIDVASAGPKGARRAARLAGVVSEGCEVNTYFRRMVVSKSPSQQSEKVVGSL